MPIDTTPIPTICRIGATARDYAEIADEEVLLALRSGPRMLAEVRDDIAARCGGAKIFDAAARRSAKNGRTRIADRSTKSPMYELTPEGRAIADQVHQQRGASKASRSSRAA